MNKMINREGLRTGLMNELDDEKRGVQNGFNE